MHPKSMGTEAPAVGTLLALIQCLPVKDRKTNVDGCSTTSCNFGALAEGAHVLLHHLEPIYVCILYNRASLIVQLIKNPPAMQDNPSSIPGLGRSAGEGIGYPLQDSWASLVAQMVKNPPAIRETWVRSLGWEDPLEKGTVLHSSILAWRIPWTEEPGRLQYMGLQRVKHD